MSRVNIIIRNLTMKLGGVESKNRCRWRSVGPCKSNSGSNNNRREFEDNVDDFSFKDKNSSPTESCVEED